MKIKILLSAVLLSGVMLSNSFFAAAQDTLDYYAEGFLRYEEFHLQK